MEMCPTNSRCGRFACMDRLPSPTLISVLCVLCVLCGFLDPCGSEGAAVCLRPTLLRQNMSFRRTMDQPPASPLALVSTTEDTELTEKWSLSESKLKDRRIRRAGTVRLRSTPVISSPLLSGRRVMTSRFLVIRPHPRPLSRKRERGVVVARRLSSHRLISRPPPSLGFRQGSASPCRRNLCSTRRPAGREG